MTEPLANRLAPGEPAHGALPPDQIIRACDYLQAVWGADDDAQARAEHYVYGELPIGHLLVDFLELVAFSVALLATADTTEDIPAADRKKTEAVTTVLIKALREWARSDDDEAAEGIARVVVSYLLTAVYDDRRELAQILDTCRATATALKEG